MLLVNKFRVSALKDEGDCEADSLDGDCGTTLLAPLLPPNA